MIIRIGKDGIPRDFFSGKVVDVDRLPHLPKLKKSRHESSAADINRSVKKTAEETLIIARIGY